jgi:hypothetical protein
MKVIYKISRFYGLNALGAPPTPPSGTIGCGRRFLSQNHSGLNFPWARGFLSLIVPPILRTRKSHTYCSEPYSDVALLRFSSGSRALAPALEQVRNESLRSHRLSTTGPKEAIPEPALHAAKLYAEWYLGATRQGDLLFHPSTIRATVGQSATYHTSVKDGGALGEAIRLVNGPLKTSPPTSTDLGDQADTVTCLYGSNGMIKWTREWKKVPSFDSTHRPILSKVLTSWAGPYPNHHFPMEMVLKDAIFYLVLLEGSTQGWGFNLQEHIASTDYLYGEPGIGSYLHPVPLRASPAIIFDDWNIVRARGRGRVIAIEEQGYKSRILTCMELPIIWTGHVWRTFLKNFFKNDPDISVFNVETSLTPFFRKINSRILRRDKFVSEKDRLGGKIPPLNAVDFPRNELYLYSVDLKEATDRIPDDLLIAFKQGILAHLENYELGTIGGLKTLSPYMLPICELEYPGFTEILTHTCGTQMGHPTSWLFLCLYTSFLCDMAEVMDLYCSRQNDLPSYMSLDVNVDFLEFVSSLFSPSTTGDKKLKFKLKRQTPRRFCGDDCLLYASMRFIEAYRKLHHFFNGEFSSSTDFISRSHGLFTEKFFKIFPESGQIDWIDSIPIKALSKPTTRLPDSKNLPSWATAGPAAEAALRYVNKETYRELSLWVNHVYKDMILLAWRKGMEPYLPTYLGGLGFPSRNQDNVKMRGRTRRAIRLLLAPDTNPLHVLYLNSLSGILLDSQFLSPISWHLRLSIEIELNSMIDATRVQKLEGIPARDRYVTNAYELINDFINDDAFDVTDSTLAHLDFEKLEKVRQYAKNFQLIPGVDWLQETSVRIRNDLLFNSDTSGLKEHTLSLTKCAKVFNRVITQLNQNPHNPQYGPISLSYINSAYRWKKQVVFLRVPLAIPYRTGIFFHMQNKSVPYMKIEEGFNQDRSGRPLEGSSLRWINQDLDRQ